jgi:7-cyano-7-deazaguanine reductase
MRIKKSAIWVYGSQKARLKRLKRQILRHLFDAAAFRKANPRWVSLVQRPGMAQPPKDPQSSDALLLGRKVALPASPDEAKLDRVGNPHSDVNYIARFMAPEFTSLCPVTGQPDFAHIVIDYLPDAWLVESKSLKLYLASFRNHGAFHEDCTLRIGKDLVALLAPRWFRIGAYFYPRGGMPIDVFWQTGTLPEGVWLPDQGVPPYRGR